MTQHSANIQYILWSFLGMQIEDFTVDAMEFSWNVDRRFHDSASKIQYMLWGFLGMQIEGFTVNAMDLSWNVDRRFHCIHNTVHSGTFLECRWKVLQYPQQSFLGVQIEGFIVQEVTHLVRIHIFCLMVCQNLKQNEGASSLIELRSFITIR